MSNKFTSFIKAKSPVILLTLGCAGVIATAVSAVFDKEKYDTIIEETKKEKEEKKEEVKKTDVIKVVAKSYWRTAVIGIFSICCIIASNRISASQLATVGAAYAASEGRRKEFMDKATEKFGEKKVNEVKEAIVEEKMTKAVENPTTIYNMGVGDQLFYESWTGRIFVRDLESVRKGVNDANVELINNDSLTFDEYCDWISGGQLESVKAGGMGWNGDFCNKIDVSYIAKKIETGPYAGRTALAIIFHTDSEPRCNARY